MRVKGPVLITDRPVASRSQPVRSRRSASPSHAPHGNVHVAPEIVRRRPRRLGQNTLIGDARIPRDVPLVGHVGDVQTLADQSPRQSRKACPALEGVGGVRRCRPRPDACDVGCLAATPRNTSSRFIAAPPAAPAALSIIPAASIAVMRRETDQPSGITSGQCRTGSPRSFRTTPAVRRRR